MTEPVFEELEPRGGERHAVSDGTVVGRENCEVVLDDPEVSRQHAAFRLSDAGLTVEDLGSSNGTYVNDRQIASPTVLSAGDTVRFGTTLWRLESAPAPGTIISPRAPETALQPDEAPVREPTERLPATPEPEAPAPPPEPPRERPAPTPPEPAAAPPSAAAAPAGSHGDVPMPPDPAVSAVLPRAAPAAASPPAFETVGSARSGRGSAARSDVATGVSFAVILATAIALVIYFGARDESDDDAEGNGATPPAAQIRPAE